MFHVGIAELIVLVVICFIPLVLVAIGVGFWLAASRRQARTTRKCPYCAETIKAEAVVCRYCGRDIPPVQAENG